MEKIKVGVIGTGFIGPVHIEAIRRQGTAEVIALSEVNAELAGYSRSEMLRIVASLEEEMLEASTAMDFERAAAVRDQVVKLRAQLEGKAEEDILGDLKKTARKGSAFGARKSSYGGGRRS